MTHPSARAANEFLSFVNASPTRAQFLIPDLHLRLTNISLAFHAVRSASQLLERTGFKLIKVLAPYTSTPSFTVTYPYCP